MPNVPFESRIRSILSGESNLPKQIKDRIDNGQIGAVNALRLIADAEAPIDFIEAATHLKVSSLKTVMDGDETPIKKLMVELVLRQYGVKCPDYEPNCRCCEVWRLLENLFKDC